MYKRAYSDFDHYINKDKVLIIYGARRIGKTTLLEEYIKQYKKKYKFVSGDDLLIQNVLSSSKIQEIKDFCQGYDLLIIDEAQNIPGIGHALKIIHDYIKNTKVIATGSSSFDLANAIGEPLVGRKIVLEMFPIAQSELKNHHNPFELKAALNDYLIYGSYPEVLTLKNKQDKIQYLKEIVGSYLYKDILTLASIKNPMVLQKLTKLLAFQVGSEVSLNELSTQLGIDVKTVAKYIDLLEKSFILYPLTAYSKNLRKEISKKNKYYFIDNGIRNAVISQFNSIDDRNDVGQLFENFLVTERLKRNIYSNYSSNNYFWRNYAKNEVDYIEEVDSKIFAYEFKWNKNAKLKALAFIKSYPDSVFDVINQENYLSFVT